MLKDIVSIHGRFLRSARIDQDDKSSTLDGYILSNSIKEILNNFARQQYETGQGAYTWTGPYGSGKSSLAILLSALLSGSERDREAIARTTDVNFARRIWRALPPKKDGWKTISIVGQMVNVVESLDAELRSLGLIQSEKRASQNQIIEALLELSKADDVSTGGLILFMDEMGKFLESAAMTNGDAYFFQLLGEAASRSDGRLIVVGILHQSFQEYASKLAREIRDEWGKIQGRFADIPVNITGDEQIELISNAIEAKHTPSYAIKDATTAVKLLKQVRPATNVTLADAFCGAWPLNPMVTLLLGPLSRRSYGQNQRSIFSFLGSSEQSAFRDYLENTQIARAPSYSLGNLWDYVDFNFQSSIAVSLDSHHFANARDAIARTLSEPTLELEVELIKSIALLELTQKQTGLGPTFSALLLSTNATRKKTKSALASLEDKSIIMFRKFRGTYALFDGSDFDIEAALDKAFREVSTVDIRSISQALSVSTVFAKRHYHRTGSLRWCELKVLFESQIGGFISEFEPSNGAFGAFILALKDDVPREGSFKPDSLNADFAIARSSQSQNLVALAREYEALKHILSHNIELQRDKIARREVGDRINSLSFQIEREVWLLVENAAWETALSKEKMNWAKLNSLASDLADRRFYNSPKLRNELLNRSKPSGNANAGLKQLLYAIVTKEGQEGLGFTKYPAEKALFVSLVEANELYQTGNGGWQFCAPKPNDSANLFPLWTETKDFLKKNKNRNVQLTELYSIWRSEPFGVKDGLMPLIAVLFMCSERKHLSHYREGIFLSGISDVDIDYILKAPKLVQLRWMDMNTNTKRLLAELANVAGELSGSPVENLEPLDVGRALIAAFESAAPWVQRTSKLSAHAKQIRALFRRSSDPTKFLFDDIPVLYSDRIDVSTEKGVIHVADNIREGLIEILDAYNAMLSSMQNLILDELQVHGRSKKVFEELNERAKNVKDIPGDLRLNAFITQLTTFDGSFASMEALAGLGINKPAKAWIDNDIDKALVKLVIFAQNFNTLETITRVKGRKSKRSAMAFIVSLEGRHAPVVKEFDVLDSDLVYVEELQRKIEEVLGSRDGKVTENLILAALARAGASYIEKIDGKEPAS